MNNLIELVNKKLDEYLEITYPETIFNSMKYSLMLPGKRLRPVMCLETVRMLGGNIEFFLHLGIVVSAGNKILIFHNLTGIAYKLRALIGQINAITGAVKDPDIQLLLQGFYTDRKRGLRHKKPLGRLAKGAGLGNFQHIFTLLYGHNTLHTYVFASIIVILKENHK